MEEPLKLGENSQLKTQRDQCKTLRLRREITGHFFQHAEVNILEGKMPKKITRE
jgi:hypothetical protein